MTSPHKLFPNQNLTREFIRVKYGISTPCDTDANIILDRKYNLREIYKMLGCLSFFDLEEPETMLRAFDSTTSNDICIQIMDVNLENNHTSNNRKKTEDVPVNNYFQDNRSLPPTIIDINMDPLNYSVMFDITNTSQEQNVHSFASVCNSPSSAIVENYCDITIPQQPHSIEQLQESVSPSSSDSWHVVEECDMLLA